MDTASKVKAGNAFQTSFTIKEAYDLHVQRITKTAREAAASVGFTDTEKLEEALSQAVANTALPLARVEALAAAYPGAIVVHRPTIKETIQIDNDAAMLAGQLPEDAQRNRGANFSLMVATLRRVVDDPKPEWWSDPGDFYSEDLLEVLYHGWRSWIDSFQV